jgi:peroxiredoxin
MPFMGNMKKIINISLLFIFLSLTIGYKKADAIQVFSIGADVRGFKFTLLSGKEIKMSDFIGKKCVIIEFWADYCRNCSKFMTTLESFHLNKTFPDVEYLGLACEWGVSYERAVNYVNLNKITFPQIWIKKESADFKIPKDNKKTPAFAADYSLPKRVFIDKSGRVIVEDREDLKDEEDIKKWLKKIISNCSDSAESLM